MILADTSIWVNHLRSGDAILVDLLGSLQIMTHPFVTGEIAMGSLANRKLVIELMSALPMAESAEHLEVLHLIERQKLFGLGIGYIDAHLLAAALLTPGTRLWTGDKRLAAISARMDLSFQPRS